MSFSLIHAADPEHVRRRSCRPQARAIGLPIATSRLRPRFRAPSTVLAATRCSFAVPGGFPISTFRWTSVARISRSIEPSTTRGWTWGSVVIGRVATGCSGIDRDSTTRDRRVRAGARGRDRQPRPPATDARDRSTAPGRRDACQYRRLKNRCAWRGSWAISKRASWGRRRTARGSAGEPPPGIEVHQAPGQVDCHRRHQARVGRSRTSLLGVVGARGYAWWPQGCGDSALAARRVEQAKRGSI